MKKLAQPFFGRWTVDEATGCWNWSGPLRRGYGYVPMGGSRVSRSAHVPAHRFSYEHFKGPIPAGLFILHECDNPRCVNPDHLRAGTQAENLRDMSSRGRACFGEANPQTKLTQADVIEIRRLYVWRSKEYGITGLAARFGVCKVQVWRIVKGLRWKMVA